MIISWLTPILLLLGIWMLFKALSALKTVSYKRNREEAEKIFRQRAIAGEDKAIVDLLSYFKKIKISIWISVTYFMLSYGLLFTSFFTVRNSDSHSPLWQLVLFATFIFIIPITIIVTTLFDLKILKSDILSRFRTNN